MAFLSKTARAELQRDLNPGDFITVFADASYCPDTKAYGVGWWIKYSNPAVTKTGHDGGTFIQGSFRAECAALEAALQYVIDHCEVAGKMVCVQSDCTGAITYIENGPQFARLRRMGAKRVYCKHVHGHRGHSTPRNSVNTTCDRLARRRMRFHREQVRGALAQQALEDGTT